MNTGRTTFDSNPGRTVATALVLLLIALAAWKSIPAPRAYFSDREMTLNRTVINQAKFLTAPTAVAGSYTINEQGLRLSPGGKIELEVARLDGLLHAIYRASGPTAARLEIRAEGAGKSTVLLERELTPAERELDTLPFIFLCNPAELPRGTERVVFSVPSSSPGAVDWQKLGSISRDQFPAFTLVPLDFVASDAFQIPSWNGVFMMVHAPTRLDFRMPVGRFRLSFSYGFNPTAFSDPQANTDGVGFIATLITPRGKRELMNHLLEPSSRDTDREMQSASFELDVAEPSLLQLTATPGPGGNTAWDWTIWRDFRLESLGR